MVGQVGYSNMFSPQVANLPVGQTKSIGTPSQSMKVGQPSDLLFNNPISPFSIFDNSTAYKDDIMMASMNFSNIGRQINFAGNNVGQEQDQAQNILEQNLHGTGNKQNIEGDLTQIDKNIAKTAKGNTYVKSKAGVPVCMALGALSPIIGKVPDLLRGVPLSNLCSIRQLAIAVPVLTTIGAVMGWLADNFINSKRSSDADKQAEKTELERQISEKAQVKPQNMSAQQPVTQTPPFMIPRVNEEQQREILERAPSALTGKIANQKA